MPGATARRRILGILLAFSVAMVALLGRLAWWQFWQGEELAEKGREIRARETRIRAHRGPILDRNGLVLAESVTAYSVFANPREVKDRAAVAARLAQVLGLPQAQIEERLSQRASYVYIKRLITEAQYQELRGLAQRGLLPGIGFEPEARRLYPEGQLAAHVLGITGIDHQGLEGFEYYYDEELRGKNGAILVEHTAKGHEIPGGEKRIEPPQPGLTAVLCIDKSLQLILEQAIDRAMAVTKAKRGALAVMDVPTGCLLAMTARPAFDPNRYAEFPDSVRRLWLVADAVSPGSIFKPVTAAAALEEGIVKADTPFHDPGCIVVQPGTKPICNWNNAGFASGTMRDVMRTSSNVGFGLLGIRLGVDRFYKYLELFNLSGRRTGIDLPGEAVGQALPKALAAKHPRDLATEAFGQTLTVTPIQMLAAINAIANDGVWVQPHVLKEFRDASGQVVRTFNPVKRQVVSRETAREVQDMMVAVVEDGTGRGAAVPGYKVAGKTGTAEKFEGGRKLEDVYIASFAGFAPVPNPRVSVLVMIDEPEGLKYGGQVAAPVFSQIIGDILRYLQIPPASDPAAQKAPQEVTVPNLVNLPPAEAQAVAKEAGVALKVEGEGPLVTRQVPVAGARVRPGTAVTAYADPEPPAPGGGQVRVPDLRGMTLRQAAEVLAGMGLYLWNPEGSGAVVRQQPLPGTPVPPRSRVQIWLQPAGAPGS